MKLLKFGGTSLANAEKFLHVSEIIEKKFRKEQIAVVLSAPSTITNYLVKIIESKPYDESLLEKVILIENKFIQLINNISKIQSTFPDIQTKSIIKMEFDKLKNITRGIILLKTCPKSIRAHIISRGEIFSIHIMHSILQAKNYNITIIDPIKHLFSTGDYLNSTVDIIESKIRINNLTINKKHIILMPGFIAGNEREELVLLGRNGSDYSAAVLSVCLNANCCEIWTDVDGVFTSDPKIVTNPYLLKTISYEEAIELSYFGAKVLHPRTIEPLAKFKIPCLIKNTTNIQSNGTLICDKNNLEKNYLKGVTHLDNISLIHISGNYITNTGNIIPRIFNITSRDNIKIILITQSSSNNTISFCIFQHEVCKILLLLKKEFKLELKEKLLNSIDVTNDLAILSVIGSDINQKHSIASKITSSLSHTKTNILAISQGSSKHSISLVIKKKYILNTVKNVHEILFSNKKFISVYLVGIGGVGKALIQQIIKQTSFLKTKNIEIQFFVIANSTKLLISNTPINLSSVENAFKDEQIEFNLNIFNKLIENNSFLNPVIIDCTSDELLSQQYVNFLKSGCHVVTSNKKANTNQLAYYNKIRETALKTNKKFLYETNVGAGLPVIETLQNLLNTGDELIRFKGILSGSLSFIFGRLEEGILLSQATEEAKKLGFTEPNPCDDLLGMDVARKLLILAREVGHKINLQDIYIEPLLPENFKKYTDSHKFLLKLKTIDSYFSKRVNKARNAGNVLRFIGTIEKTGQCSVKIEEVNMHDPLYKIKNGENALAFYTNYYQPIPLLLRGYGAGNNVTASGVFSNLLRTIL